MKRMLNVFLCHASNDKDVVKRLYDRLVSNGIDAWLDSEKLLGGQEWRFEIPKAVRAADAIIVCISNNSISKEGYLQKEIKIALDIADEKPEGTNFLIPVRLENCPVPERLSDRHWINLFEAQGYHRLIESLKLRADRLRIDSIDVNTSADLEIDSELFVEPKKDQKLEVAEDYIEKKFIKVSSGVFWMGSKETPFAETAEKPQHEMKIPYDFWMARYPVTNREFLSFIRKSGRENFLSISTDRLDHPVTNITWYDALDYCRWLTQTTRQELKQGYGFRLPSEAEWEMAARGALPSKKIYPWGNDWFTLELSFCNSFEEGLKATAPIGTYSPHGDSYYKVAEMAGNVREWTRSAWGINFDYPDFAYPYSMTDGRESLDLPKTILRVARGGSFLDNKNIVTCSHRFRHFPFDQEDNLGFRLAISPLTVNWAPKKLNEKDIVPNIFDGIRKILPLKKRGQ